MADQPQTTDREPCRWWWPLADFILDSITDPVCAVLMIGSLAVLSFTGWLIVHG